MSHEQGITDLLKQKGYRLTNGRKAIIKQIAGNTKPFTAQELHVVLKKKGLTTNVASVYRELAVLSKENVLRPVSFNDGVQRYELATDDHHHHLLCLKCNAIEDVHMDNDLDALEKKIGREKKFKVTQHSLEFYGFCSQCQ